MVEGTLMAMGFQFSGRGCVSRSTPVETPRKPKRNRGLPATQLTRSGNPNAELDLQRVNNGASDFILKRKYPFHLAVVRFRPKAKTAAGVNQFGCHTNAVTFAAQTSFKHITDV